MKSFILKLCIVLLMLALLQMPALAIGTYDFTCISSNDPSGDACSVGESAFKLTVDTVLGQPQQVLFTFETLSGIPYGDPPEDYYIDGVYFFDGYVLSGIDTIIDRDNDGDSGVDFEALATPGELPGFDELTYPTLLQNINVDDADANPASPTWGVNAGESLGVLYDLLSTKTYDDVIAGLDSGQIVIGIKGQGFGEFSEGFITTTQIPAPGAIMLGGIGVSFVGWLRRRKAL